MLTSVRQVRKTLGVLGYQQLFIQGFTSIARPIVELTKKGKTFKWTNACHEALDMLIEMMTTAPVLAYPDLEQPFEMEVDASAYAVGAILFQKDDQGHKRDISYYLKALNPAECNYDIWDQEFLCHWPWGSICAGTHVSCATRQESV
jgi:RNase H-like domain found in reverse transcriptase